VLDYLTIAREESSSIARIKNIIQEQADEELDSK